jgi:predicted nucleic acid-binding protein
VIVVDSSVWIGYLSSSAQTPQTQLLDDLLGREKIVVGDLILAEVLRGFRSDRDYRNAKSLLASLDYRGMIGREIALMSAANYRRLRKKGITVRKTIDCLIATFCITERLPLLHADDDFRAFEKHLGLVSLT